jgi:hypothetical protein
MKWQYYDISGVFWNKFPLGSTAKTSLTKIEVPNTREPGLPESVEKAEKYKFL